MTADGLSDPGELLSELEGAFAHFDEARMRLHVACIGAAQGLVALRDRIAVLEGEVAALRAERGSAAAPPADPGASPGGDGGVRHDARQGELEGELASLRDEVTRLREELERERARVKKVSSGTKVAAAAPPPVPEAKAFAEATARPAEKPPNALDVDALLLRARTVKQTED